MLFLLHTSSLIPPPKKVDDKDNEGAVDVWDESWVRDRTVDERKKNVTAGFGVYSIAEAWEWQRQLNKSRTITL